MFCGGIKKGFVFTMKRLNCILNTFFMTFPCLEKTVSKMWVEKMSFVSGIPWTTRQSCVQLLVLDPCTKLWHFIQFSTIVASQHNYENCGILWHTISLSYNCRNLDIYFDSSKRSETKFGTAITICVYVTVNLKYIIHYGSLLYWSVLLKTGKNQLYTLI